MRSEHKQGSLLMQSEQTGLPVNAKSAQTGFHVNAESAQTGPLLTRSRHKKCSLLMRESAQTGFLANAESAETGLPV